MNIVTPIQEENLGAFAKAMKKHRYEVYAAEGNLIFQSKHRKPGMFIIYLMFFLGVMRLVQGKMITGSISLVLGVAGIIIINMERKKYEMTYSDIEKVAVSPNGISFSFRDQHRERVHLTRGEIQTIYSDIQYDGNFTLGYVLLKDVRGIIHTPIILMNKSEQLVTNLTNDVVTAFQQRIEMQPA